MNNKQFFLSLSLLVLSYTFLNPNPVAVLLVGASSVGKSSIARHINEMTESAIVEMDAMPGEDDLLGSSEDEAPEFLGGETKLLLQLEPCQVTVCSEVIKQARANSLIILDIVVRYNYQIDAIKKILEGQGINCFTVFVSCRPKQHIKRVEARFKNARDTRKQDEERFLCDILCNLYNLYRPVQPDEQIKPGVVKVCWTPRLFNRAIKSKAFNAGEKSGVEEEIPKIKYRLGLEKKARNMPVFLIPSYEHYNLQINSTFHSSEKCAEIILVSLDNFLRKQETCRKIKPAFAISRLNFAWLDGASREMATPPVDYSETPRTNRAYTVDSPCAFDFDVEDRGSESSQPDGAAELDFPEDSGEDDSDDGLVAFDR